jgi:hypothetical protein
MKLGDTVMKKLLALLLVLGFTSVAGAAAGDGTIELFITSVGEAPDKTEPITPTKEITIEPSMWVDLTVIYNAGVDNGNLFGGKFDIHITGPGSFGPLDAIGHNEKFTFQDVQYATNDDTKIWITDGGFIFGGGGPEDGEMVVDNVLIHCDARGDVKVELSDDPALFELPGAVQGDGINVDPVEGGVIIHQIPEPMTLSLLGLGGLALLRRRRS